MTAADAALRRAIRAVGGWFEELAHVAEFFVASFEELLGGLVDKFAEGFDQIHFQAGGHLVVVAVGGAEGFFDHVVDDAKFVEVAGGELEGAGGVGGKVVTLPEDACAAFGADHAVVGELEHGDAVADANAERPAGAAFADHDADDRRFEARHFEHALGDDLGLAAFFRPNAGVSTGGVDQANDGQLVLSRHLHFGHRFAVAFGMGAAEETLIAFFERFSFVVAGDHDFVSVEFGEAGAECAVVAIELVAVELDEFVEHQVEIVGEHRPIGMAGNLDRFPGVELAVDAACGVGEFAAERTDLVAQFGRLRLGRFEFGDALLEGMDRLFEGESVDCAGHGVSIRSACEGSPAR